MQFLGQLCHEKVFNRQSSYFTSQSKKNIVQLVYNIFEKQNIVQNCGSNYFWNLTIKSIKIVKILKPPVKICIIFFLTNFRDLELDLLHICLI